MRKKIEMLYELIIKHSNKNDWQQIFKINIH